MSDQTTSIATFVAFAKLNYTQCETEAPQRHLALTCG